MYYAKVNWYNDYDDVDENAHMIICAENWTEAMEKAAKQFKMINTIEMRQIHFENCDVVYITEDILETIERENTW